MSFRTSLTAAAIAGISSASVLAGTDISESNTDNARESAMISVSPSEAPSLFRRDAAGMHVPGEAGSQFPPSFTFYVGKDSNGEYDFIDSGRIVNSFIVPDQKNLIFVLEPAQNGEIPLYGFEVSAYITGDDLRISYPAAYGSESARLNPEAFAVENGLPLIVTGSVTRVSADHPETIREAYKIAAGAGWHVMNALEQVADIQTHALKNEFVEEQFKDPEFLFHVSPEEEARMARLGIDPIDAYFDRLEQYNPRMYDAWLDGHVSLVQTDDLDNRMAFWGSYYNTSDQDYNSPPAMPLKQSIQLTQHPLFIKNIKIVEGNDGAFRMAAEGHTINTIQGVTLMAHHVGLASDYLMDAFPQSSEQLAEMGIETKSVTVVMHTPNFDEGVVGKYSLQPFEDQLLAASERPQMWFNQHRAQEAMNNEEQADVVPAPVALSLER